MSFKTIAIVLAIAACFVVGIVLISAAADISGRARVIDGDTLEISGEKIRLYGIDAFEKRQTCTVSSISWPCGKWASDAMSGYVAGQDVTCSGGKRDRYGRIIAVCRVGDTDINARMVHDGWALSYRQYSSEYVPEELEARAAGAGAWAGQFTEPWVWRKTGGR